MLRFTLSRDFSKMADSYIEWSTVPGSYIVQFPGSKGISVWESDILEKSLPKVKRSMKF